jgi:hypothetical protein
MHYVAMFFAICGLIAGTAYLICGGTFPVT